MSMEKRSAVSIKNSQRNRSNIAAVSEKNPDASSLASLDLIISSKAQ